MTQLKVFFWLVLIIPIFFLVFRALNRNEELFTEKNQMSSKPWIILMAWVIIGLPILDEIKKSQGLNEILVRSAMVILGIATWILIFWLGFGRWYSARVAERKASMAAQATVGGLS